VGKGRRNTELMNPRNGVMDSENDVSIADVDG
jgi:hypothetical protein